MPKTGLLSLLVGYIIAMLPCSLLYLTPSSLSQNAAAINYANLTVIVKVEGGGPAQASDFDIEVSSLDQEIDVEPSSFSGSESGTTVTLAPSFYIGDNRPPPSRFNYSVSAKLSSDSSSQDYSAETSEGCSGSLEPGHQATCTITNYYHQEPVLVPDFEIEVNPEELHIQPGGHDSSTITLIPSQHNNRDNDIDIKLGTEWIGTSPNGDDVNVALDEESTPLVGTQQKEIGLTVHTSPNALSGQIFTLHLIAEREATQANDYVVDTANIEIVIGPPPPVDNNNPPKAVATLDENEVNGGEGVKLDGTQSSDSDGDTLTYSWKIIRGPANAILTDEESDKPTITYLSPRVDKDATIRFELTVSDGKENGIDNDSIELRVSSMPIEQPPIIIPLVVVLASIVIGGIALGKSIRRIKKIPSSAVVKIRAKGGIDS